MDDRASQQDELETYLLLLLSDSALPTGGFVASSGLESFIQHGFIATDSRGASDLKGKSSFTLLDFLSESLVSYSLLNLPFFQRAHLATWRLREAFDRREVEDDAMTVDEDGRPSKAIDTLDETVQEIVRLDAELEAMLLNHVTRRANKAQGVALLTLYTKAFGSLGSTGGSHAFNRNRDASTMSVEQTMADLIDALKTASRKPVRMQGHLPICFAVLTAALGLSLGRSLHLHLFLQARAILSSAVRLNLLGPYAAQRMLLTDVRPVVSSALATWQQKGISSPVSKLLRSSDGGESVGRDAHEEQEVEHSDEDDEDEQGPATTWPLGEILAARHDQLHSRIFNS